MAAWATVGTTRIVETIAAANITKIFISRSYFSAAPVLHGLFFASLDRVSAHAIGNRAILD